MQMLPLDPHWTATSYSVEKLHIDYGSKRIHGMRQKLSDEIGG
jgi:hypothetical protein